MLCQACKKAPATLHLTSLKSCRAVESHYCEPCSRKIDLAYPFAASVKPPPDRTK
jgi:protein-arginine kinase activator protein McsA